MLILPVSAVWGALYLALGSPVGVVPLVYFAVLLGAIAVFSRTRDFPRLLLVAQVDILLAPTLSMIPLGGFVEAGGVGRGADQDGGVDSGDDLGQSDTAGGLAAQWATSLAGRA